MKTPQSRIDDLVARPSEGLPVEVKSWIDPTTPEGAAKIVRGCLAMRNHNGGFMIFGLNDQTLQVETAGRPANVRDAFHTDKIQQLVSRYAHETFEIEVAFAKRDGTEVPVIVVPDGIQYPVASKGDLVGSDGKKLVRIGDVYCRTLNANGRASTAVALPKDWRDLFDRCFENREADIGRFLRRHLGSSADGLQPFGIKPHVSLQAQTLAFLGEGNSHFLQAASARNLTGVAHEMANGAKFEVALIISPQKIGEMPTATFRQTLASANPNLTGWPMWLDSAGFRDETARPRVRDGTWQALIVSAQGGWSDHLDFQLFDPNGRFYLLGNLQDDGGGRAPGSVLDPIIAILRVAETIAVGLAFARALGWEPEDTTLAFAFRWSKLTGRKLESWANPGVYFSAYEKTATDTVTSYVEVPLDTPQSAIAPVVEAVVRQLFVQFGGYQLPSKAIEDWTRKLIERRL
ncbi:hypothetical protein UP10_12795 [Bradyrhizobium sp. LTSPM299]|uniref:AlbA family DNA-binding domain-containing protein n=1 Tax=Bradyrhizobium sp. LTSPM299 TaxID=1619233 RepID=UPI0005C8330C|nr:RNA-binding domain-containing protein [Bradyrhizobium sp. LTSPM299]KJC60485.1 hypothetical protein UP10_12795 [Bradyrhizobium sp. LTSPM299]